MASQSLTDMIETIEDKKVAAVFRQLLRDQQAQGRMMAEQRAEDREVGGPTSLGANEMTEASPLMVDSGDSELTSTQLDENFRRPLKQSLWDVCAFLYLPQVGDACSTLTAVIILISFVIQMAFVFIVWKYMLDPSVTNSKLSELLSYRLNVAHDIDLSDKFTHQSLVTQVCKEGGNDKLHMAAGQVGLQKSVQQFRYGGIPLCILAQICWLGSIFKEFEDQFYFITAFLKLPRGPRTVLTANDSDGLSTKIESVSTSRLVTIIFVVVVPRFIIATSFGVVGIRFLCTTSSMENLVLNALALGFVFDIDELLFDVLAPRRLAVLINTMMPMMPSRGRAGTNSALVLACMVVALFAIVHAYMIPFQWRLNMAYDILCGGEKDFVFAENPSTGMIHVVRTPKFEWVKWTQRERTILQVAGLPIEDRYGWGIDPELVTISQQGKAFAMTTTRGQPKHTQLEKIWDANDEAFLELAVLRYSNVADLAVSGSCEDASDIDSVRNYLSYKLGLEDFECHHLRHNALLEMCSWLNMTFLRALCPVGCGCSHDHIQVIGTGLFDSVSFGCPRACSTFWQMHKEMNAPWALNMHLQDKTLETMPDLSTNTEGEGGLGWIARYFRGIQEVMMSRPSEAARLKDVLTHIRGVCDFYDGEGLLLFHDNVTKNASHCIQTGEVVDYILTGGMAESLLNGQWKFHPSLSHPRGLKGCQFLVSWEVVGITGIDLCSVDLYTSIRSLCPHECRCSPGMTECPTIYSKKN